VAKGGIGCCAQVIVPALKKLWVFIAFSNNHFGKKKLHIICECHHETWPHLCTLCIPHWHLYYLFDCWCICYFWVFCLGFKVLC